VTDNGWFTAQSIPKNPNGDVPIPDDDLTIATVSNVTVNATGPNGATVNYTVPTVTDSDDASAPAALCLPAAGVFAIGPPITVQCTATDSDDTNSPQTTSFTVTVVGATGQLAALKTAVQGVGTGTSLADKITQVQAYLAAKNKAKACGTLNAFITQVKTQSKSIATANQLIGSAMQIEVVVGC
jgi:hypothetical protein